MDWSLLGLSFAAVFLSELGDKSQVAAIALGGSSKFPKAVFLGTASALLFASLLGVLLGQGTATLLPAAWVKIAAALGFLGMGIRLIWFGEAETTDSPAEPVASGPALVSESAVELAVEPRAKIDQTETVCQSPEQ